MDCSPVHLRWPLAVVLLGLCAGWAPTSAHAQPVIVVIESDDARTDRAGLLAAIATHLTAGVVRLSDPEAARARGTLSISIARGGQRAFVYYRARTGVEDAVLVEVEAGPEAERGGLWLAEPAAATIRTVERWTSDAAFSEVLDPWLEERLQGEARAPQRGPVNPFPPGRDVRVGQVYFGSEVLDPWEHDLRESPDRLTPPSPPSAR